jgi:hypothetical protein
MKDLANFELVTRNEWSGEVLIPQTNLIGYQRIYEAETWLRRICLASFLLAEGPAWAITVEPSLRSRIQEETARNSSRWYLGADSEEELLWSTTQGQLGQLLRQENIGPHVLHLCGIPGELLAEHLKSLAQIRNTLAHNRAISEDTLTILEGSLTIVTAAVKRFKGHTLYASSNNPSDFEDEDHDLREMYSEFEQGERRFPDQQLFFTANDDFVFLVRLPVQQFGRWPNSARMSISLGISSHLLLCVLANKECDELQFVMPRRLPSEEKIKVLHCFMTNEILRDAWTETSPDEQNPARACWPKLWFYENRRPDA